LGIIRLLANHTNPDFNLLSLIERSVKTYQEQQFSLSSNTKQEVIQFINDRLVVYLQSQSLSCVPSVLATSKDAEVYNIRSLAERSFALENFLTTSAGTSLKATYRRAAGILDKTSTPFEINPDLLTEIAEKDLYKHIQVLSKNYHSLLSNHEYQPLMEHLAQLRTPIDAFFDTVMVNCDDEKLKNNRFALLQLFIHSVNQIADFSQLQG
jgi:glycyl-tRNA synthetase beta chain